MAVILAGATGTLLAQPTPLPTEAPAPTEVDTATTANAMSLPEMRAEIEALFQQAHNDERALIALQAKVRKEKDVVKLSCVNDKLVQYKALLNILDGNRSTFEGAAPEERTGAFNEVRSTSAQLRQRREEAFACAGELELRSTMEADWTGPDFPDDPSKDQFPDGVEPPGYASPFN